MKREAKYEAEQSGVWPWSIYCESCPLLPHLEALGEKRRNCQDGIQTNVQGHVVLSTCEHYERESLANEPEKKLSLVCKKEDPK